MCQHVMSHVSMGGCQVGGEEGRTNLCLAMSIPALVTTGDGFHCHLSHPLASERCSQLLTALTGLQLQSLSSPEDASSFFLL